MARPEGTPIEPGFLQRAARGIGYVLVGDKAMDWFGPSQPQAPMAPPDVKGRAWDYSVGTNLQTKPRGSEGVSFEQLRALADNFDLLRLAAETRKDQLCRLEWSVQPKQQADQQMRDKPDHRCVDLESFLRFPDRRHSWSSWLRMLTEDLLVIDAPAVYVRKSMSGDVYSLDVIDGSSIKPLVGADGRPPLPPAACYQQVLKGVPAIDYNADELLYVPRNPRSNRIYGFSPVEQIMMTVNIGIRRQLHQLQHYTEGNVPEALCGVPEEWSPDQVEQFQKYWDSLMEGNTAARRHMKFVPGKLQVQFTKESVLKDQYDEWLARVVCYAFSLPPTAFVQQMNRATAETAQDAALEEGLAPLMQWVKDLLDLIIQKHFGHTDLEFVWKNEKELDPAVKQQLELEDIKAGVLSLDEVRQSRGKAPYGIGPMIFGIGPAGFIMIEDLKDPAKRAALLAPPQPAFPGQPLPGPDGQPPAPGAPPSPTLPTGGDDPHQAAVAALQATLDAAQPQASDHGPQPFVGANPQHQAALDRLSETLGMPVAKPASNSGLNPQHSAAIDALMETLALGKSAGPFLTKADGRAGRDGDGDGKLHEGKKGLPIAVGVVAFAGAGLAAYALSRGRAKPSAAPKTLLLPSPTAAAREYAATGPSKIRAANVARRNGRELLPSDAQALRHIGDYVRINEKDLTRPVFRGLPYVEAKKWRDVKVGDVVSDAGFMSTSKRPSVAEGFASHHGNGEDDIVLRIHGARGADMKSVRTDESEVLIPPGNFRVINREVRRGRVKQYDFGAFRGKKTYVDVEVVKSDGQDNLTKAALPSILSIAEAAEAGIAKAIGSVLVWWGDQAERIAEDAITAPSPDEINLPVDEFEARFEPAFNKLKAVFAGAGEATINDNLPTPPGGQRIDVSFDLRNKRVAGFLDGYRMDLIRHITDDQAEQVRSIVSDASSRGEPPATMMRRIRDVVGLTPYQAGVVESYRAELEALSPAARTRVLRDGRFDRTLDRALDGGDRLSDEQIDKMVEAYKRRFLDMRAMTIARTESIRAANHGARQSVANMLDDPEMAGLTVEKTWVATADSRTRDSHRAMNGQTVVGMDAPFVTPDGVEMSGPHDPTAPASEVINCRCVARYRLVPVGEAGF